MAGMGGGRPSNYDEAPLTQGEIERLNRMLSSSMPKFLVVFLAGAIMFGIYVLVFAAYVFLGIMGIV